MKLFRAILLYSLLQLIIGGGAAAQRPAPEAVLVDEFGLLCSEDLMARYDYFLNVLSDNPVATGLIIFYGDKTSEGRNVNLFRYVSEFYPQIRQFKDRNIKFKRASNGNETKIQFWLVPAGAESPTVVEPYRPFSVTAATRYDVAAADFHVYGGKTYLYLAGFYELGCNFPPYYFGFIDQLRKDRSLTGYVVVYTKFGTGARYGSRVARFAMNELLPNPKISPSRIKTVYGGNKNNPEIEFWLVPKGGGLPPLRPDIKVKRK